MRASSLGRTALAVVLASIACGPSESARVAATVDAAPLVPIQAREEPATARPPRPLHEVAAALLPSVVSISAPGSVVRVRGRVVREEPTALGTGFVIDRAGHLLTNHHVVAGVRELLVTLADGTTLPARVVGVDPPTDLALLEIPARPDLVPAPLGRSGAVEVGEWVLAIGHPFGLAHTVTAGIISARGRTPQEIAPRAGADQHHYASFLQTDAAINPGNSGGPLIRATGEVIGINTAIHEGGPGIGFAIPIDMARELVPRLLRDGRVERAGIGIYVGAVSPEVAARAGLPSPRGALVARVLTGSPAERAGLRAGDIVLEVDARAVDAETIPAVVALLAAGRRVPITIWRNGARRTLEVVPRRLTLR